MRNSVSAVLLPNSNMLRKEEDKPPSAIWIFPQAIRAPEWLQKLKSILYQLAICCLFLPCCYTITIHATAKVIHISVNNNRFAQNWTNWSGMQLNNEVFKVNYCATKWIRPWTSKHEGAIKSQCTRNAHQILPRSPTCRRSIESYLSPCTLPNQAFEYVGRAEELVP